MDLIVILDCGQGLAEECNRVLLAIFPRLLEQDYSSYIVQAIYFNSEECREVTGG